MNPNQRTDFVPDCDSLVELVPEYAFGLTTPEETRMIEANLQRCPEAVARLSEYQHLQDEMREAVPQIEPPAQLGTNLMAAVAAPSASAMTVRPAPVLKHVPAPAPATTPQIKPRRLALRIAWAVAAAAVIALVATNLYWLSRVSTLTQSNNVLTALQSFQSFQNGTAFVLTSTDSLHWVRLAAPDQGNQTATPTIDTATTAAAAFMMWNNQSQTGLLYARNFPALKPGQTYHLWLTQNHQPLFVGVFTVDDKGDGALLFKCPEAINDFDWAWVTAQTPQQSTGKPVGDAVVSGALSS
ncbi:MAG TPA: anti-sigma factor [Phototrophicaceae bacterium]|nr:anti-sigma factor [Phototrophicaceae bacterium]